MRIEIAEWLHRLAKLELLAFRLSQLRTISVARFPYGNDGVATAFERQRSRDLLLDISKFSERADVMLNDKCLSDTAPTWVHNPN